MKLLFYSPIPWPHLTERFPSFPHSNEGFSPARGVQLYRETLDLFRFAEDVGFDWLGIGEEHMNAYGIVPNPCLIAAALATTTVRAKICILGNPLPLLNPLRVAEEYAMIDLLSRGRLVAGFPRGVPQNFEAYGISSENSRERLQEAVAFVLSAWRQKGVFDWNGKYYTFRRVSIWPQPISEPELVFSAKSPESVLLAVFQKGVLAELYVKSHAVINHFLKSMDLYRSEARNAGWVATPDRFLLSIPCVIARSDVVAEERAEQALQYKSEMLSGSFEAKKQELQTSYYKNVPDLAPHTKESLIDRIAYGGVICGSPSTVVAQIRDLISRTGVGVLGLQMQVGNLRSVDVRESLYLFGKYCRSYIDNV